MKVAYHRCGVRVRFDPEFLKKDEERREEKKKLLKMADARTKENCRQLFSRLIDPSLRAQLTAAVQDPAFDAFLVGMMDRMGLQANNNVVNRLYSMTILQAGNFDNLYDNEGGFRGMIRALLGHVQANGGGPFSGMVTILEEEGT